MKSAAVLPRARTAGLIINELDDETLIYDLERHEAHCLNQTAALVWRRCDGRTTVEKMTDVIQKQLDTSVDVDIVWLAIKQLQRFHLIENGEGRVVVTPSVSRRELLLKYAPAALNVFARILRRSENQGVCDGRYINSFVKAPDGNNNTAIHLEKANRLLFEVIEYVEPRMKTDQAYPPVVGLAVMRARHGLDNEQAERRFVAEQS